MGRFQALRGCAAVTRRPSVSEVSGDGAAHSLCCTWLPERIDRVGERSELPGNSFWERPHQKLLRSSVAQMRVYAEPLAASDRPKGRAKRGFGRSVMRRGHPKAERSEVSGDGAAHSLCCTWLPERIDRVGERSELPGNSFWERPHQKAAAKQRRTDEGIRRASSSIGSTQRPSAARFWAIRNAPRSPEGRA